MLGIVVASPYVFALTPELSKDKVTAPAVPPPVSPAPAVTSVMSAVLVLENSSTPELLVIDIPVPAVKIVDRSTLDKLLSAISCPPDVAPSCTTRTFLSVSTVNSPMSPTNEACCAVVTLRLFILNPDINFTLYLFINLNYLDLLQLG